MATYFLYFHGFASGPSSTKGEILYQHIADKVDAFIRPDLNGDDFFNLTMPEWFQRAAEAIPDIGVADQLILSGSSLGAYTAACLYPKLKTRVQASQVQLLLLAPAFGFAQRWSHVLGSEEALDAWREQGQISFFHYAYNEERSLSYAFYESCRDLPAYPKGIDVEGSIIHGQHDEVLGSQLVQCFANKHTQLQLHLLEDDHALLAEPSQALICSEALRLVDACR